MQQRIHRVIHFAVVLCLWLSGQQFAAADGFSPGGLSDCPVGDPSNDILHGQTTMTRELVFECPFDPGHTATTRTYFITNNTGLDWTAYLFDVELDDPTKGFRFGWTNGGVFTPSMISGAGQIDIDGLVARILFDDPLAPGEQFAVRLRFADYVGGTASVHGTPVTEPGVLALMGLALAGLAVRRRR